MRCEAEEEIVQARGAARAGQADALMGKTQGKRLKMAWGQGQMSSSRQGARGKLRPSGSSCVFRDTKLRVSTSQLGHLGGCHGHLVAGASPPFESFFHHLFLTSEQLES